MEVFSFVTTLPNTLTQTINHERSLVLLISAEDAFGLIKASDAGTIQIVQSDLEERHLLAAA